MDITADTIIDDLGGTSATAALIHAPISTVHSWREIGISASRLAHLKLAASAAGKVARWPVVDGNVPGRTSSQASAA